MTSMSYFLDALQRFLHARFYVQAIQAGRCTQKTVAVVVVMWSYSILY